jgi:hypothetical protein
MMVMYKRTIISYKAMMIFLWDDGFIVTDDGFVYGWWIVCTHDGFRGMDDGFWGMDFGLEARRG